MIELEFEDQKATLFDMIMDRDKFVTYVRRFRNSRSDKTKLRVLS